MTSLASPQQVAGMGFQSPVGLSQTQGRSETPARGPESSCPAQPLGRRDPDDPSSDPSFARYKVTSCMTLCLSFPLWKTGIKGPTLSSCCTNSKREEVDTKRSINVTSHCDQILANKL